MDLNFKAKVRSAKSLVEKKDEFGAPLTIEMMVLAGKRVTINFYDEDDGDIYIKEDHGGNTWEAGMFEGNLDNLPISDFVHLSESISDNSDATVKPDGNIHIGCQEIKFVDVENLYLSAVKQRKKYARLLPKLKKRRKRKKNKRS